MSDIAALVGDLAAEQAELESILAGLSEDDWLTPTPAWSWDVRDTVAHLADTDEMAISTATGGPDGLNDRAALAASGEDVTYHGVRRGRRRTGREVEGWWITASAGARSMLLALPEDVRVPWGIGMRAPSLATARLMETWAHGLDIRAALGLVARDTDRLAHVAWLATRALPYAYSVSGREIPPDPLRVELTLPSGRPWTFGPETAADRICGSAGDYCRVFVHRLPAADTNLVIEGDAARAAISVARAFL